MKKLIPISLILLSLVLCFSLISCNNDKAPETTPETAPSTTAPDAPETTPTASETTPGDTTPEGPDATGTDALGFFYTLNEDGESYSIGSYTGTAESLTLPASFNELPVTAIGDLAFSGNTTLKSVTIPD